MTREAAKKVSTGITGLPADVTARATLVGLYRELSTGLTALPADYRYRRGLDALLVGRLRHLEDASCSDVDVETAIGEGQLEELVAQARDELTLLARIRDEWQPWNK